MNRHPEFDTREHLLATGEQLCLQRGFTAMGLSELLRVAKVPKGSFYHYFRSKEDFGVVLLEQHYQQYTRQLTARFSQPVGNYRDKLLGYYQDSLALFYQQGKITCCLTVKLSAEVCDLSEDMRTTIDKGTTEIIALLANALEKARDEQSVIFEGAPQPLAQVFYALWLGANLHAKISRSAAPLENALSHVSSLLIIPA